jgi:ADP-ribose pyrophosphatase
MPKATIKSVTPLAESTLELNHYVFSVERYEGGVRDVEWDVMERGHSVGVLGYDPHRDEVVLINEFRPGAAVAGDHPFFDTIVAGTIDGGESPLAAAVREMKEEAGLALSEPVLVHPGAYVSAGGTSEKVAVVVGVVDSTLAGGIHGKRREDENIKAVVQAADEFVRRVKSAEILDMKTIVAGLWLAENAARLRARMAL